MQDEHRGDNGGTDFIKFVSFRERVFFVAVSRIFFALRFTLNDSCRAAEWAVILWRVLCWTGSDNDLRDHCFLGRIGYNFEIPD